MRRRFRKKNLRNMAGIAVVLCLLAAALMLPELYFSYYDKRTQNELEYLDAQVDTYQIQYEDFSFKIAALALGAGRLTELSAARLQEADEETQERLTTAVNRELDSFAGFQPVWETFSCRLDDLKSCELYTAYPKESGSEQLRGFTFWRITYEKEDEYELRILLDAEFEKIVSLCVWNKTTQICFEEYTAINRLIGFDFKDYNSFLYELQYMWIDGMANYYGIYNDITDWGNPGSYEEAYGMSEYADAYEKLEEAVGASASISANAEIRQWPSGYSVIEFYGDEYGYSDEHAELILEYYMCKPQEKGCYVTGFRCFNDFLQL